MTEIVMPRLSDTMEEGTILSWLVADGELVSRGQELVEIETDKANMTYESDQEGVLQRIAAEGDTLPVGAVIALAQRLHDEPLSGARVLLVSTGSEESFSEGMSEFLARHGDELDPSRTELLCLECLGGARLIVVEGEGMLRMRDHDASLRDELQAAADETRTPLWRGLRLGAGGTDALPALRAGYRAACLAGCTELKVPANYHQPSDVPENLCWQTIDAATTVAVSLIRRIGATHASASPITFAR